MDFNVRIFRQREEGKGEERRVREEGDEKGEEDI